MASCFKPGNENVMKIIEDRRNIHLVFGKDLKYHLTEKLSKLSNPGGS